MELKNKDTFSKTECGLNSLTIDIIITVISLKYIISAFLKENAYWVKVFRVARHVQAQLQQLLWLLAT